MPDIWTRQWGFIKNDKVKCRLIMTSKEMGQCRFYFYEMINVKKIIESQWYDNFFNVIYDAEVYKSLNLFQGYGQVKVKK